MKISVFNNDIKNVYPESEVSIKDVHNYLTSEKAKEATTTLREVEQSDLAKEIKAKHFKFATFSGTFTSRSTDQLKSFSGLVCIDIDDVPNLTSTKKALIIDEDLQPTLVFTSPSGTGIKAVYRVDPDLKPELLPYVYDHIAGLIEAKHGVVTDRLPKSVASACFLPWDPDAYLNTSTELVELHEFEVPNSKALSNGTLPLSKNDGEIKKVEALISYLEEHQINIAESYREWMEIGLALSSLGEKGRPLYHRASSLSSKYDRQENDRKYDSFLKSDRQGITLGTFFHRVKEAGVPSGEVLAKLDNFSVKLSDPDSFWTANVENDHRERCRKLIKDVNDPIIKWISSVYGISLDQLSEFSIGLDQHSFKDGQITAALYVPHEYGIRVFTTQDDKLISDDLKGSHVTDSFYGTRNIANRSKGYIPETIFEAISLSSDPEADVISPVMDNGPRLGKKQAELIADVGQHWKEVYIFKNADFGDEERKARKYVRAYADVLHKDTEVYWVNAVKLGLSKDRKAHEIVAYIDNKGISIKKASEYIWNSWTEKNRFTYLTEGSRPRLEFDMERFPKVLKRHGFIKYYPENSKEPVLLKVQDNTIEEVENHKLFDFIRSRIISKMSKYVDKAETETAVKLIPRKRLVQFYNGKTSKLLNDDIKAVFDLENIKLLEDDKDTAYLFYSNTALKVTKDSVTQVPYKDLPGKIWSPQIIDRPFHELKTTTKGEFETFVENISGGSKQGNKAFKSALGYSTHSYKDKSEARAIILVDEDSTAEKAEGGTGKSIFAESVGYFKNQRRIAGKNLKTDSQFLFMDVKWGDQSYLINDAKKNFDFESFFNMITDDMMIEAKYENRVLLPFKHSPKMIITTNYTIPGDGNSYDRRQLVLPLTSYYNKKHKPDDDFGRLLFDDWDEKEWLRFDHFMIECLQEYLANGFTIPSTAKYEVRRFKFDTSPEFYEWATHNMETEVQYDLRGLFRGDIEMPNNAKKVDLAKDSSGQEITAFFELYPSVLALSQAKTFNEWMIKFGDFKGWSTKKYPSNGGQILEFN